MVEDVGFHKLSVLHPFQGQHITPGGIHEDELHVLFGIQIAEAHEEGIVIDIQALTHLLVLLLTLRLVSVEPLVSITEGDIQDRLFLLRNVQVQRNEGGTVFGKVFQHADVVVFVEDHGTVAIELLDFRIEGARLHGFFLLLCLLCLFCLLCLPLCRFRLLLCLDDFDGFHRRLELRVKRVGNVQGFESFLPMLLCFLTQGNPSFGSHGHHQLIETVEGRILFP